MFTEFTRKRINEYVPDVNWMPIDINIVRFQISGICTLTSFLRDHLGYRGCYEIEILYHFKLNSTIFSAKIFTRTTKIEDTFPRYEDGSFQPLSFYKRYVQQLRARSTVFSSEPRIQFTTLHRLERNLSLYPVELCNG